MDMKGINPVKSIVKEACKEKGISVSKLALSMGISPVYLSNVLNNKKTSKPLVRKLAEVLGVPNLPSLYESYLESKKSKRRVKRPNKAKAKSNKGGEKT